MKSSHVSPVVLTIFLLVSSPVRSQEIEQKGPSFGIWTVYCVKDVPEPKYQDCSIVAGGAAKDNPEDWAKIGISIANQAGDPEMTIRIPFVRFLKSGISVGFDGKQSSRSFIDTCTIAACEAAIDVDARLSYQIGTSDKMTIEYQVKADESVALGFDLEGIVPALSHLRKVVGLNSAAIASLENWRDRKISMASVGPLLFTVERREVQFAPAPAQSKLAWNAPYNKCYGTPTSKVARLTIDMKLENQRELDRWAEDSSKCFDTAVMWIKAQNNSTAAETPVGFSLNDLGSWTLHNSLSKKMRVGIVPDDTNQVPVVAPAGLGSSNAVTTGAAVGLGR